MHITPANIHNSEVISEIPDESGTHYIFNRGHNDFNYLNMIIT